MTVPWLGRARPVLFEAGVQSADVHRSSGWSPYRSVQPPLLSSYFQHVSQKGMSKISV